VDAERAVDRGGSLRQAAQPAALPAGIERRAAPAVVVDHDAEPVAGAFDGDLGVAGVGVFGDVGERLGDDEVGDGLDACEQRVATSTRSRTGSGAVAAIPDRAASRPRSLALAWGEGYLRVFVDEGPPMASLLGKLTATGGLARVPVDYLRRLQEAFARDGEAMAASPQRGAGAGPPGLVQPLSDRELEVPALLAAGKANPGDRRGARGHARHGQEARDPHPRQARRRQPDPGRHPRARARIDLLDR
jgi:hypothetical protein